VTDHDGHRAPARVSLTSEDGRFFAPNARWIHADDGFDRKEQSFEAHYFHTAGDDTVTMPSGKFHLEVMSGFERPLQAAQETTTSGTNRIVHVQLGQKWQLGKDTERWISGDLHVHMNYGGAYKNTPAHLVQQAEAEDLAVVNDLVVNKDSRVLPTAEKVWTRRPSLARW